MNNRPKQAYCIIQSSQAQAERMFKLAVIFIHNNRMELHTDRRKDGTYGTKKETPEASERIRIYKISRQRTL